MPSRVLLIDDSLTVRKITERQLLRAGLEVAAASTGGEGIQQAITQPPDVIVVDYMLPDLKGTDICDRLQQTESTKEIPVIVLSGREHDQLHMLFKDRRSVKACMAKPFEAGQLIAKIHEVAGGEAPTPAPETVRAPQPRSAPDAGARVEAFVDEILGVFEKPLAQRRLLLRILVRKHMRQ